MEEKINQIIRSESPDVAVLVEDHAELLEIVTELRKKGYDIGWTVGVYDVHHLGHARYLWQSKLRTRSFRERPTVLIVGIDTDAFTKLRKGDTRPIYPYDERWEMLIYNRGVGAVTCLGSSEENNALLQAMKPDVVVLSFSSTKEDIEGYAKRMHEKYDPYCGRLEILERQAEASTSVIIYKILIDGGKELMQVVEEACIKLTAAVGNFIKKAKGEGE